jgi:hypothetical protein
MLRQMLSHLFYDRDCGNIAFAPEQIDHILRLLVASDRLMGNCWYEVLPLVERAVREHPLTPERRQLVWAYVDNIVLTGLDFHLADEDAHTLARLDEMTGRMQLGLRAGDPWADEALADVAAMPEAVRSAWEKLVQHALTATTSRPTKVWLRRASDHIAPIGWHEVEEHFIRWFDTATCPATLPMHDHNATILRGLVWCCTLQDSVQLAQAVGRLGEAMFRKVGFHVRSLKAGNACLYTLSMMPGMESIAQLARLSLRVKGRGAQKAIGNALAVAAQRAGLARDEVEEMMVPTFDLDSNGRRRDAIDGYIAEITIVGTQQVQWCWLTPDGTAQKSVPAPVKAQHAGELKALKRTVGEMQQMLAAQRERLERLFLLDRSWPLAVWRERYLDHPLLAQMCRRLIWHFRQGDRTALAAWHDGRLVDLTDHPLDWLSDETVVRLWHPIGFEPETVLSWRLWLEEHGVTQPFKQAHREVYILTDAELATRTYSNRFAGHILRQHQLYALCQQSGWRYRIQGPFDSGGELGASRVLSRWGPRAEYWIDAAGGRPHNPLSVKGGKG